MTRLSCPIESIKSHYTVVVIGSGYGGAIAASRLARAGQQVCVLERGREFQPGEYPDTELEALAEIQAELPGGHVGSRVGLYNFHVNLDVNVMSGCGLGGTSLINANAAVRPERRVFEDACWPRAMREDGAGLAEGYRRAEEMLRPTEYPDRFPALPKLEALERSAERLGHSCGRAPITVTFTEGINHVGVPQHPCMLCGDCISGCNYGAKNTVLFNYLPDARNFGAEIFTRIGARHLERTENGWTVHYQLLDTGLEEEDAPLHTIAADIVILAAGTLGSTEILLRSKARGLPLSDRVGHRFSGNGDVLGFSYGCTEEVRGVGYGHRDPRDMEAVGPAVAGMIDMRGQTELDEGLLIHEIAAPGALSGLLPVALANAASALGRNTTEQALAAEESEIESLFAGPYDTLANETQAYLVTTHEQRSGEMRLEKDRLRIAWPHAGDQPIFERVNEILAEATRALGGDYLINPVWSTVFNRDMITLHPLGGCVLAEDAGRGVVNHKGQAFRRSAGTDVHEGLYVCDGSVVPRSLGVGPLLTIAALAERTCALLARDRGWKIDYRLPSRRSPLGIQFWETLRGDTVELHLTAVSDDLDELIRNRDARARVAGRALVPELSPHPLKAYGEFSLAKGEYRLRLKTAEGAAYYLHGRRDGTSLLATVHEGESAEGVRRFDVRLSLLPQDLRRQLTTLQVSKANDARERLDAIARFGRALAGDLYEIYGGIADGRKKRPLRVNAPTVHALPGSGGRLLRYEGGSHGPVLLAAAPGLASLIYSLDTIETNLVEYLFAHSYDVWVLDATEPGSRDAAVAVIKETARTGDVRVVTAGSEEGKAVELNAATRESVPESWHHVPMIGMHAARDLYPTILRRLQAK